METEQSVTNKGSKKILFIVGGIVLLCCCLAVVGVAVFNVFAPVIQRVNQQIQQGVGYNGIASEGLKTDVLNAIAEHEASQTGCSDVTLFGGQMIASPDQSADGSWIETWQVTACGESHLYSINFTPSPTGGTDFFVNRIDQ